MTPASRRPFGGLRINFVEFYRSIGSRDPDFLNLDDSLVYFRFTVQRCGTLTAPPARCGQIGALIEAALHVRFSRAGRLASVVFCFTRRLSTG
jgi:hypothetical protein